MISRLKWRSRCSQWTVGWLLLHPLGKLWQRITLQNFKKKKKISKIDPIWCRRLSSRIPQQHSEIGPISFSCTYHTTNSHGSGMGSMEIHLQSSKDSGTKNTYPVKSNKCVLSWINIINEFVFQYPWITQHAWHLPLPPCEFCNLSSNRNLNDRTTGSDQLIILSGYIPVPPCQRIRDSGDPWPPPKWRPNWPDCRFQTCWDFSWCSTNPKTNVHPGNRPGPKTKINHLPTIDVQGLLLLIFRDGSSKPWSK